MLKKFLEMLRFLSELWAIYTSQFFAVYIWPTLMIGVGILAGVPDLLNGLPFSTASAGVALTLAGLIHFVNQLQNFAERNRIDGKLIFSGHRLSTDVEQTKIGLGITLLSSTDFELEFEVAKLETNIGDRIPAEKLALPLVVKVPPHGIGHFTEKPIVIEPPVKDYLMGHIEYEVLYGLPGKRRYKLSGKKTIFIPFDENSKLLPGGEAVDAV